MNKWYCELKTPAWIRTMGGYDSCTACGPDRGFCAAAAEQALKLAGLAALSNGGIEICSY